MNWLAPHDPVSAWTHGLWMLAAVPAGAVLVWKNRSDAGRLIGMSVFAVSLIVCFGSSAFYHAAPDGPLRNSLHLLDYLGIYLLIAGTATPIAVIVLRGWWRRWLLIQIWTLAVAGGVLRVVTVMPQLVSTILYVALGWIGVVTYFELARRLSHAALRPLLAGGLC
jgi:hemolysin III